MRPRMFVATCLLVSTLSPSASEAAPIVDAAIGEPFGVARIKVPLDPREDSTVVDTNGYSIKSEAAQIFYPTFSHSRLLSALRQLVGVNTPGPRTSVTVHFLFRGDKPFSVTIGSPSRHTFVVAPKRDEKLFARLQDAWWRRYASKAALRRMSGDYPPIVETYLPSMLAHRLGLKSPLHQRPEPEPPTAQESLMLVLSVASMRMQAMERMLSFPPDPDEVASLPLPAGIDWPARQPPPESEPADIEPIAKHVPEECFYIRYGNFTNYLWAKRVMENNGGSLGRMVSMRGHDPLMDERAQAQLGLRDSPLADVIGPRLISDVVLIGRDTYLSEGAAIGILFEARNRLLRAEIMNARTEAVRKRRDLNASIKEIRLSSRTVSFAATPDNRLRSFYVMDGKYHLVTNSREIARRFLEVSAGQPSLGDSADFRYARSRYPVSTKNTVFAYLTPAFFQGLVSPQYQIELRRRLTAIAQLELVQLARLAARHEAVADDSVASLRDGGFLPPYFQKRPDHSQILIQGDRVLDSLRGTRGTFLPIPDVTIEGVTAQEAATYAEIERFHRESWRHIDPLVLELKRSDVDQQGLERLQIRAEMLPFSAAEYGRIVSLLGPPTKSMVQPSDHDAISVQAIVQGGSYRPEIKRHIIFFGVQDKDVQVDFASRRGFRNLQIMRTAPAYLGSYPSLGFLRSIPLEREPVPDADGFVRLPFGIWKKENERDFSVMAFDRNVLSDATSNLTIKQAPRAAQVRFHIDDLSQSKIQTWFAALDFQRAYQTSIANTRLLNTFIQQLGVRPEQALTTAEAVLGVTLICALGGEYQHREHRGGGTYWLSTRWPETMSADESRRPVFVSPLMAWFRGVDAELTMESNRLTGIATVTMQNAAQGRAPFRLFNILDNK